MKKLVVKRHNDLSFVKPIHDKLLELGFRKTKNYGQYTTSDLDLYVYAEEDNTFTITLSKQAKSASVLSEKIEKVLPKAYEVQNLIDEYLKEEN